MKLTALILAGLLALTGLSFGETVIEEAYEEPIVTLMGTVNEFTQEGLLLDTEMGPVLVLTNEETLLEGFDALEKLEAGRRVEVMYNGMMTRSIPAQITAQHIGNHMVMGLVSEMTEEIYALAGGGGKQGTGGMVTKLSAAKICMDCGCDMVIANGDDPANLYDIIDGKPVGTRFTTEK